MNTLLRKTEFNRPLFINFHRYTDGDSVYKKELIGMIIDNLRELQHAQLLADQQDKHSLFLDAHHKMKFTISLINDKDLTQLTTQLSDLVLYEANKQQEGAFFTMVCNEIVKSLEKERAS